MTVDDLDGCELDFSEEETPAEDVEKLLVPEGQEEDEDE
jgi:hypothetical protein